MEAFGGSAYKSTSAGIGGGGRVGNASSLGNITITSGAKVTAHGGTYGVGIGASGYVGDISITDGADVTAVGGPDIVAIGSPSGAWEGMGNITIIGAAVTANGGGNSSIVTNSGGASKVTIIGNTRLEVSGVIGTPNPNPYNYQYDGDTEVRHIDENGNLLYIHQPR